jgi:hypothetical protein
MFRFQKNEEYREPFCGACVAGVAALAGAGTAGGSSKVKDKKTKDLIFYIGASVTILSIIILIYLLCFKKCDTCR